MTPAQFRAARGKLGLSAAKMAAALSDPAGHGLPVDQRTIRRWESGERRISSPAIVAVGFMLRAAGIFTAEEAEDRALEKVDLVGMNFGGGPINDQ